MSILPNESVTLRRLDHQENKNCANFHVLFNACRVHRSALKHKDWTVWGEKSSQCPKNSFGRPSESSAALSASTEGGCSSWRVNPSRSLQSVPRQVLVLMLGVGGAAGSQNGKQSNHEGFCWEFFLGTSRLSPAAPASPSVRCDFVLM